MIPHPTSVTLAEKGWQPIETAPKDGSRIDLWLAGPHGSARVTDCWWGLCRRDKYNSERETWMVEVPQWETELPVVDEMKGEACVTHWMRLPDPPVTP